MAKAIFKSLLRNPSKTAIQVWRPSACRHSAEWLQRATASRSVELVEKYSYSDIAIRAFAIANELKRLDLSECYTQSPFGCDIPPRVAVLCTEGIDYISATVGLWLSGLVSVPLCLTHPTLEQLHSAKTSKSQVIIHSNSMQSAAQRLVDAMGSGMHTVNATAIAERCQLSGSGVHLDSALECVESGIASLSEWTPGVVVFTSGTTNKPKGAVHTHKSIAAAVSSLQQAWHWQQTDNALSVLPLHHIHGLVNVNITALATASTLSFVDDRNCERMDATLLALLNQSEDGSNVFMAVPTIYCKLLSLINERMDAATDKDSAEMRRFLEDKFRLMVSGSSALPSPVFDKWQQATGHRLLERYGMTEINMALSNPLEASKRKPATVGFPLPSVEVRIDGEQLEVRGPTVFREYLNEAKKTTDEFTADGWFKTGDCVSVDGEGYVRIEGRSSVDIIKTSGFKVSALEVERVLLAHPTVDDCSVLGIDDQTQGETVAVVCQLNEELTLEHLRAHCKEHLAAYKVPRKMLVVDAIPKNAMNKVNKKELKHLF